MIKTRAVRDGNGWRICGRKLWNTNSSTAEWCIVFAVTDPDKAKRKTGGISGFLVPTDAAGFAVESVVRLFGHSGGHEGALMLGPTRGNSSARRMMVSSSRDTAYRSGGSIVPRAQLGKAAARLRHWST